MNLDYKLDELPPIIYCNLDERPDRREYTESQYEKYKIKNFTRYSSSKYQFDNFHEWKNKLILNDIKLSPNIDKHILECSITLTHLELLNHWLEKTNDKYFLLMEDDYDLSFIDYWHFDWKYLMNNIPFDSDCILLSFENDRIIPCFLHRILTRHSMGAALLTRSYVEKIIKLVKVDDKFDLTKKICNYQWSPNHGHPKLKTSEWNHPNITTDYILGHCGVTYCLPLLTQTHLLGSYSKNIKRTDFPALEFTNKAVTLWWKKYRDRFSLDDFFMYGKPNDFFITIRNIYRLYKNVTTS